MLQGKLITLQGVLLKAIIISTASNNLLKAMYAFFLGERRTAKIAGSMLAGLAGITLVCGFWGG